MMPNCDLRDRFVYLYLAHLHEAKHDFQTIYLEKRYNRGVCHFELKCFDVIVTCGLKDEIT